jgi:hypothetical protein
MEWGEFSYKRMPSNLVKAPMCFSKIIVEISKNFIYKSLEVYLDDWELFGCLKNHVSNLRMMMNNFPKSIKMSILVTFWKIT